MNEINKRIADLVNEKARGNKSEFAKAIGAKDTSVRLWMEDRSPDVSKVIEICRVYNVSPAWILLGEGSMDGTSSEYSEQLKTENSNLKAKVAELESKIEILYNALDAVTRK